MNKIYFCSDTHFGHEFISKKRGFSRIEDHDQFLIDNWNSRVDSGDRIYILGDFIWNKVDPEPILKQLKGEKYFITGNHDRIGQHNEKIFLKYLHWIKTEFMLKIKQGENIPSIRIFMHHFPFEVWDVDHYGSFHCHGHIHGFCRHKPLSKMPNRYDVGVEPNNYYPIEWEEILQKLKDTGLYKKDYREELAKQDQVDKDLDLLMNIIKF